MKKAQLDQTFIMIFGIVVMALVLAYGSYVIYNTYKTSEKIDTKLFSDSLTNNVERCYNLDAGSFCSLEKMNIPDNLVYVCFLNPKESINYANIPNQLNQTIYNYINRLGRDENVFVSGTLESSSKGFKINNLIASENPLCERTSDGKLNLVLENKGNFVSIRK